MLKELKSQHRQIIRLKTQGIAPTEIATRTGMKVTSVYAILRDPLAKGFMMALEDKADEVTVDVRRRLAGMQTLALDNIENILTDADVPSSVGLAAAKDVLDRNGHKPSEKVTHLHGHFTTEDLKELRERKRALERRMSAHEEAIDVTAS